MVPIVVQTHNAALKQIKYQTKKKETDQVLSTEQVCTPALLGESGHYFSHVLAHSGVQQLVSIPKYINIS